MGTGKYSDKLSVADTCIQYLHVHSVSGFPFSSSSTCTTKLGSVCMFLIKFHLGVRAMHP